MRVAEHDLYISLRRSNHNFYIVKANITMADSKESEQCKCLTTQVPTKNSLRHRLLKEAGIAINLAHQV